MFRQAPSFPYHDLGIVEDGTTASRAISKDSYVIWKGSSYFASTDILQGATLEEDVNLTSIPDGVINGVVDAVSNNFKWHEVFSGNLTPGATASTIPNIENYEEVLITCISTYSSYDRTISEVVRPADISSTQMIFYSGGSNGTASGSAMMAVVLTKTSIQVLSVSFGGSAISSALKVKVYGR